MATDGSPGAWRPFLVLWLGQSVSVLGSRLSGFAFSVWVFQETGSVARFSLLVLSITLPGMLVAPVAGALVDRLNRRTAMILADTGAAVGTLAAFILLQGGHLEVWHLFVILGLGSVFNSLQLPAYVAAVAQLVPKEQLGRTSGMVQLAQAGARILAPAIAGYLVVAFGVRFVLLVDFATFAVAVLTLAAIRIPDLEIPASALAAARPSLGAEIREGWRYLRGAPGLLGLAVFAAGLGLIMGIFEVVMLPLVLSFSDAATAGVISSTVGFGMLAGSLVMSAWGGPERRILGILAFSVIQGFALVLAGWRPSAALVGTALFLFAFSMPIVDGCNQVIWQRKVAQRIQGRVFALRRIVIQSAGPLGILAAGPLSERVFEPAMAEGGVLARSLGPLIGSGPGRGLGLMLIAMGLAWGVFILLAGSYPKIRNVETDLPEGDEEPSAGAA